MVRLKIIDKVKKLLALATSNNPSESAAAAAAAQALIDKWKVEEAELYPEDAVPDIQLRLLAEFKRIPTWRLTLASALAEANQSRAVGILGSGIFIIATEIDMSIIEYLYLALCNDINQLTKREASGRGSKYILNFRLGCAVAIRTKLHDRAAATCTALVRTDHAAREALDNMDTHQSNARPTDHEGLAHGIQAGQVLDVRTDNPGIDAGYKQIGVKLK